MRILSMTATFGKLENRTLTLKPGLNVISAPNEWGKSTWCAFIAVMLYGLDTREKTTKTTMAVKERYAPWSGTPMAGRMDLLWNGRAITIERNTKGRTPMGEFKAYETESGLPVPELTATGCGETLLGVEKSVFLRAGFLRLADLPVTADESLRRRLNALVTTGDESDAGDILGQKLKDLKNKVRFNRSGLIPQAEAEKASLEETLAQLRRLQSQCLALEQQQSILAEEIDALENHAQALQYAAEEEKMRRISQAQLRRDAALAHFRQLEKEALALPDPDKIRETTARLERLHQDSIALGFEQQALPQPPQKPQGPDGNAAREAVEQAKKHGIWLQELYRDREKAKKLQIWAWIAMLAAIPFGGIGWLVANDLPLTLIFAAIPLIAGILVWIAANGIRREIPGHLRWLEAVYGNLDPQAWLRQAEDNLAAQEDYLRSLAAYEQLLAGFRARQAALTGEITALTQGLPIAQSLEYWQSAARKWEALEEARRVLEDARSLAENLQAMAKPVDPPAKPDTLNLSPDATARALEEKRQQLQLLQQHSGQYQGAMAQLGSENALQARLDAVNARLHRLGQTYQALELALQTLQNATAELQRRFAPKIAADSRDVFAELTGGRYDRLMLRQDLTVDAGADGETATRSSQWRSDGTVDQLYFALRLTVARALTPEAPLVLDDVLVRFDDTRHAAAMEVLRREAQDKQVILFTCQSRETEE